MSIVKLADKNHTPFRIAVTGPESTGKTTLATRLAQVFDSRYVPEFARTYVENLPHRYTFDDVEVIAREQVKQYRQVETDGVDFIFFDTWLIITKVWFEWVFGREPAWLDEEIKNCPMDLFLLCRPDLPWETDPVRENGGENRLKLFDEYRKHLVDYGFNFIEIGGIGNNRLENAIAAINSWTEKNEQR